MRKIAFKTASHVQSKLLRDSLPEDFITEWTHVDSQPEGSLKEEDGWQFMDEDKFLAMKDKVNHNDRLLEHKAKRDAEMNKRMKEFAKQSK